MPVERFSDEDLLEINGNKATCMDYHDTLEYKIGELSNEFVTNEKLCITDRASIMDRVYTKMLEYKSQWEVYKDMENMDSATAKQFAEVNALVDFFSQLHEDLGELDNKRVKNCETLVNMLRQSNVYKYLDPEVQEYEY